LKWFARPLFGYLIDRLGLIKPSLISLSLIGLAAIMGILNQGQSFFLYILTYGLFWFNLGAWLSIMPSMIKAYYGSNYYARVYGMIFTAYGLGVIISTLISGSIIDALGDTLYLYISILGLLGFGYIFIYKLKSYEPLEDKALNVSKIKV
jgi:OFA family oxalate/formate antiporter-like MFS transporter